jgi:hypothetical protein
VTSSEHEQEARSWLDLQLVSGRYSSLLVRQLTDMTEHRSGHVFLIIDEIALLEGAPHARPTGTKGAEPLTGILTGLMHKHYFQPGFVLKNVQNFVGSDRFGAMVKKVRANDDIPEEQKINYLLHRATISGLEQKSQSRKLTGEWIVYKRYNKANYYFTLGSHTEDDQAILERVLALQSEFPDLRLARSVSGGAHVEHSGID